MNGQRFASLNKRVEQHPYISGSGSNPQVPAVHAWLYSPLLISHSTPLMTVIRATLLSLLLLMALVCHAVDDAPIGRPNATGHMITFVTTCIALPVFAPF